MVEIFGTLGPSCSDEDTLRKMFMSGMTGVRLNLSHVMLEDNIPLIKTVQKAAQDAEINPKILIDIQGPELRIGTIPKDISLYPGDELVLGGNGVPIETKILRRLQRDMELLFDDGKILCHVISNNDNSVIAKVDRGGILKSRKSIAVKDNEIELDTLTSADLRNISCAVKNNITGIMQPFVRGKNDINTLKEDLNKEDASNIDVYAKIENCRGLEKLDEIIEACDEIIIARGDLGNAIPLWELPGVQKKIAAKCLKANRRFMVVTQMISSMENNPVPTRAEVSDIFNAVLDGAASVMVTGETAIGKYPVEVIQYLMKTVDSAEKFKRNF